MPITETNALRSEIQDVVNSTPVFDIHTHLYPPSFGQLCLWGIDELVTYHYLIAELFRSWHGTPQQYWALSKQAQADLIWDTLFVRNTPLSEACRGVVNVMTALGLDPSARDLSEARAYFSSRSAGKYIKNVMRLANVSDLVMTNDPFNETEASYWRANSEGQPKFHAALRMDPLINEWPQMDARLGGISGARKFLEEWIARMRPLYMAVSLPDTFVDSEQLPMSRAIRDVVLPTAREHGLPFAMMIGVRRKVNPLLGDAGDGVGTADLRSLERICRDFPDNRFLVTLLSRENQHELCVIARKFGNLMPFGCWWFLNDPSVIHEITSERIELLGASFIPQHSDCRIVDQLIYKWSHSRRVIADVLFANYWELVRDGYKLTRDHIQRDVTRMFSANFEQFVAGRAGTQARA
jgi:hypothetical protein